MVLVACESFSTCNGFVADQTGRGQSNAELTPALPSTGLEAQIWVTMSYFKRTQIMYSYLPLRIFPW